MSTTLTRANFVLVDHLQATWKRAAIENLDQWLSVEREKRLFPLICAVDPTGGLYHSWLSRWRRRLWDSRGFRCGIDIGDIDELRAALSHFHSIKDTLSGELRDVGQYHSVGDLLSAVPTRIAEAQRRRDREALKATAYRESKILFRDGRWVIVQLNGYTAAQFWGLGTRWCTTSAEHVFHRYADEGALLVFLTPHGKYQMATSSRTFRDERDAPVDLSVFRAAPPEFFKLLQAHFRG